MMKFNKNIFLKLWFITYPYYLLPSGNPQIADLFMLIYIILNISIIAKTIKQYLFNKLILFSFMLILVVFIVQTTYTILYQNDIYIKYMLFYIYNFIILLSIFSQKEKIKKIITYKVYVVTVVSLVLYYFINNFNDGIRLTLSFNNPNQLSLYILIMSMIGILLFEEMKGYKKIIINLTLIILFYFMLLSLSKAGIISILIFYILYFIKKIHSSKILFVVVVALFTIVSGYVINNFDSIKEKSIIVDEVFTRLSNIGKDKDDSAEGRGYGLIISFPEYLILGAGEGNNKRLHNWHLEIHSLFGNLLFSYGFIAIILMMNIFYLIWNKNIYNFFLYIFPIILLSLTHNVIRSRIFWVFLTLVYIHNTFFIKGDKNEKYNFNI